MKKAKLILLSFLFYQFIGAQNIETTLHQPGIDYNHYSIETTLDSSYVAAGTLFDPNGFTDIHIIKLDQNGAIVWEKIIDVSEDDRALDVAINPSNEIVITGYTSSRGMGMSDLYIAKLNSAGVFMGDNAIELPTKACAGTNIIYSNSNATYVVGGLKSDFISATTLTGNNAFVVEFDLCLSVMNSVDYGVPTTGKHSSINDIIEIPGGYFITGSSENTTGIFLNGRQTVLNLIVDGNFNILNDLSFDATNWDNCGVSAVYYDMHDYVFLLSNNSIVHNPEITVIDNISNPSIASIVSHYTLVIDTTYGNFNAAGFQMRYADKGQVVIAGYFRTYSDGSTFNNAIPWVVRFNPLSATLLYSATWNAPSENFYQHGGGIFSTFNGEHPYIFNQEILTPSATTNEFVMVGPRKYGSNFGIDIVSTALGNPDDRCFNHLDLSQFQWSEPLHPFHPLNQWQDPISTNSPWANLLIPVSIECPACDEERSITSTTTLDQSIHQSSLYNNLSDFQIKPNPATDELEVSVKKSSFKGEISIFTMTGNVIFTSRFDSKNNPSKRINIHSIDSGTYIIRLKDENGKTSEKQFIKI